MIVYDAGKWNGYGVFLQVEGSVVSNCLPQAIAAALLCLFILYTKDVLKWYNKDDLGSAYGHQVLSIVLAFLLIFRTNFSFMRYWEARGWLAMLQSKLTDLALQTRTFSVQEPISHARFARRMQHLLLVFHSVCMQECAREEDLDGEPQPADLDRFRGGEYLLEYPDERMLLAKAPHRPLCVMAWICEAVTARQQERPPKGEGSETHDAGFRVPPPVLARSYQQMSECMLAFNNLLKIAITPVPFPYCQMSAIMLNLFAATWPFVTALLIDDWAWAMGMAFIITFAFYAFDAIAQELQDPFGDDPNDLPLVELQDRFHRQIHSLKLAEVNAKPVSSAWEIQVLRERMMNAGLLLRPGQTPGMGPDTVLNPLSSNPDTAPGVFPGSPGVPGSLPPQPMTSPMGLTPTAMPPSGMPNWQGELGAPLAPLSPHGVSVQMDSYPPQNMQLDPGGVYPMVQPQGFALSANSTANMDGMMHMAPGGTGMPGFQETPAMMGLAPTWQPQPTSTFAGSQPVSPVSSSRAQ